VAVYTPENEGIGTLEKNLIRGGVQGKKQKKIINKSRLRRGKNGCRGGGGGKWELGSPWLPPK